jgi:hypothetical protein
MQCHLPFKPVLRLRHHCRLCGKVFCHACCGKRLLLPPRYNLREPQRACEMCSSLLQPLQPYLTGTLSRCVQPPVHDALDAVSLRRWVPVRLAFQTWAACIVRPSQSEGVERKQMTQSALSLC